MPVKYVLDAHAILWFAEGNSRLGAQAKRILEDPQSAIILPVIAFAEACWTIAKGRTYIRSLQEFLNMLDADSRISFMALDREIVEASMALAAVGEMHDRQIVATAAHLIASGQPATLLTMDTDIKASGIVPVLW